MNWEDTLAKLASLIELAPLRWKQESWGSLRAKTHHYVLWLNPSDRLEVHERGFLKGTYPFLRTALPSGTYTRITERLRGTHEHTAKLIEELDNLKKER